MRDRIRIDDICRTERYYTATLLPCILFHDSFAGLKAFFDMLVDKRLHALDAQTFTPAPLPRWDALTGVELITEAALGRDAKYYSGRVPGCEDIELGTADAFRPDLVVIANDALVVLEAKFFGDKISTGDIRKQLLAQRDVIRTGFLRFKGYHFRRYCHLFLSAKTPASPEALGCQGTLSWRDIGDLAQRVLGKQHYVTQRLARALALYDRASHRLAARGRNYRDRQPLGWTLRLCKKEGNAVQIGFAGGVPAIERATQERLRGYSFKWDWVKNPTGRKSRTNWIPGDRFVALIAKRFPELQ